MAKSTRGMRSATSAHSASHCPDEGEIISLDFDLQLGSEQKGRRPALVLSPKAYNSVTKLCIVCPITNKVKNYPFEVALPENVDGLTGVVLSDQVKNLSWDVRGSKYLGEAPAGVVFQVKEEDEGEGASRDPLNGACRSLPPRRTRERLTADAGRRLSPMALPRFTTRLEFLGVGLRVLLLPLAGEDDPRRYSAAARRLASHTGLCPSRAPRPRAWSRATSV